MGWLIDCLFLVDEPASPFNSRPLLHCKTKKDFNSKIILLYSPLLTYFLSFPKTKGKYRYLYKIAHLQAHTASQSELVDVLFLVNAIHFQRMFTSYDKRDTRVHVVNAWLSYFMFHKVNEMKHNIACFVTIYYFFTPYNMK